MVAIPYNPYQGLKLTALGKFPARLLYGGNIIFIAMKILQDYTIVTRPDDNGTFVAYVPAISGCHAWGKSSEAALSELVYVFEMIQKENRTQKYPKVPSR